mmetsp:Transcript_2694/g.10355  ORF Transcript_2694/g.10355 Transcript_2694/m.10355 type:complete len:225 (-) Transcript_2694:6298-6972(-)
MVSCTGLPSVLPAAFLHTHTHTMTLFSIFLFDRNGTCLFSHHPIPSHQPNQKLIYGLLFALSNAASQLGSNNNSGAESRWSQSGNHPQLITSQSDTPSSTDSTNQTKEKFLSYQTSFYNLHYLETPTKLKIVCFTSRGDNVVNLAEVSQHHDNHTTKPTTPSPVIASPSSSPHSLNRTQMRNQMKALYHQYCEWLRYGDFEWGEEIRDVTWRGIVEKAVRTWNV